MTAADDDLVRLMDQRIRLGQAKTRATGTVVGRDAAGPKGMVLFDGATVATPVKFAGGVYSSAGDRCLLDKYGTSDWVVTNSWAASTYGEANRALDGLGSTTSGLTSNTFVDLTEFGTFTFTKFYDATFVRVGCQISAYANATNTQMGFAVRLTPTAGGTGFTATDYSMGKIYFSPTTTYMQSYSARRLSTVPAGTYTVAMRWRRISGTGSLIADANCPMIIELDERVRASVPIL